MFLYSTEEIRDQGGLSYSGEIAEPSAFTADFPSDLAGVEKPLRLAFDISIGPKEFFLLGQVSGRLCLTCSRCAEPYRSPFSQELEEIYSLESAQINVGEQVRQSLLLALPAKPLCSPDCAGLCPQCGINLKSHHCGRTLPRANPFAKLKDLFEKKV